MDDFGTLARDYGFSPQGKSAPMASTKANTAVGSDGGDRRARVSSSFSINDHNRDGLLFTDVFGGPPKYTTTTTNTTRTKSSSASSDFDYDSIFKSSSSANESKNKSASSGPVYDKPVYDEDVDIFAGLPGLKSKSASSSTRYEDDVFSNISSTPNQRDHFDDLLGNLGRTEKAESKGNMSSRGLNDLIPGFGGSSPTASNRPISESSEAQKPTVSSNQTASTVIEDPFVVLESTSTPVVSSPGLFTDPLEEISKLSNSGNTKVNKSSVSGEVFDDINPLNSFGKSVPSFSSEMNNRKKDGSPSRTGLGMRGTQIYDEETIGKSSFRNSENHSQKKIPVHSFQESHHTLFDIPTASPDSREPVGQTASSPSSGKFGSNVTSFQADMSPKSQEHAEASDDIWLTVLEISLITQPTSAPPPSRPPPPRPPRTSKSETGSFTTKKGNEFSYSPIFTQYSQSPKPVCPTAKSPVVSQIDELEDFAMGRKQNVDEPAEVYSSDEVNVNSAAAASAAAMKEAMDRAETKFRHAKEAREREYAKAARSKEAVQLEKEEQDMQDAQDREFRENQERLDSERQQRESEEEEREQRRLDREREREKARQAVERATREARERAAAEARLKVERAAVEKANAQARERAERAAVQRAQAEARERAATEARERAEKAAAEARERANAEAREKEVQEKAAVARAEAEARRRAERAAVERAAAEARQRAAAEAREKASRVNQKKNDNDLESFFSTGSRPSSAPRPRANSSDPVLSPQMQSRGGPEGARRTPSGGVSSNMRKASSATNIVDDLTSIFGAAPSSGEFPDVEGESEERRRARLERHQRTQERAAKALAEKNQRDLQTQRDQEERHRIAETLDVEIKRWAAGKEGNLRALLSTLQYVLWPECGWQPVSLTDLITGASVKKVYRKATLCIHPDKVQQKGANLQQRYVAEKVFDLLKEAWNKFNSEELF
ncbi:auxilin-related protein 2-like [Cornus florida]|uniref:auxilin-related protein 2-like n=1 Tax=Cornus florida TaxID=4283 RepID=UPI00289E6BD0|nr:auxilin-related protein 2-like [Cornus florida]